MGFKKFSIVRLVSLCIGFAGLANSSLAQVAGCRDPLATNYSPAATFNDGSCTYITTAYTPPIKVDPISAELPEGSGLQMAGNFLWSFNDGGGAAVLYRIDTITNSVLQKVTLEGAANNDWEDIAFDGSHFYIGDFGNNSNGARTDLKIYTFPFAALPDHVANPIVTVPSSAIGIIHFAYSDQPQPPAPTATNTTKFDCEAMIVNGGKLHLFTKNWIDNNSTHYVINGLTAGNYLAVPTETLATGYLVTAADKAPGQNTIALLGYQVPGYNHYMHLLSDYGGEYYFSGNKRKINLPSALSMGQAEGLCFRTGNYGYISNEKVSNLITINQKLRSFSISNLVTAITTTYTFNGNGNWNDAGNWLNQLVPPANISLGAEIFIDPAGVGQCLLNVPYTLNPGVQLTVSAGKKFVIAGNLTIIN